MKLNTAIIISVFLHLLLVILLTFNYQFSKIEVKQSGSVQPKINAKAIDSKRVEQLIKKIKQDKLNKKQLEQNRLNEIKQAEEKAKRKRREEETKAADAIKKLKVAEEKRKAEEVKAEALKKKRIKDEQERKKKADQEKKLKAETERKNKIAEEKRKKAQQDKENKAEEERKRKLKEEAEKKRQEAIDREMQRQMDSEAAELAAVRQQQVLTEVDKFKKLIENKINRNWFKPEQIGFCILRIDIASSGIVFNTEVLQGDSIHCDSGSRAVRRAEPLPISKDPEVYAALKELTFKLEKEPNE